MKTNLQSISIVVFSFFLFYVEYYIYIPYLKYKFIIFNCNYSNINLNTFNFLSISGSHDGFTGEVLLVYEK